MTIPDGFAVEHLSRILVVTPADQPFTYDQLRIAYNEVFRLLDASGTDHLLVDFQHLRHFGSTFLGMLIRLAQRTRRNGGDAVLCNLAPAMLEVFDSLMLLENVDRETFWVHYPSRAEAISALTSPGSSASE